jgi:hypothetical protein
MLWLLACSNSMRPVGGAPFDLQRMASATITQTPESDPEAGVGFADLLLSSGTLRCGDALDLQSSQDMVQLRLRWFHESFDISDPGVDMGWEGLYTQAADRAESDEFGSVHRSFFTSVVVEGERWDLDRFPGELQVEDFGELVSGTVDHQWVKGRFEAERCGQDRPVEDTGA